MIAVSSSKSQIYRDYCQEILEKNLFLSPNNPGRDLNSEEISKVVLIMAGSRSGSSLLFELLRNSEQLLSLSGEHTPYYKIRGYSFPFESFRSDSIDLTQLGVDQNPLALARDLISDLRVGAEGENFDFEEYAHSLIVRLSMQWTQLFLPYQEWMKHIRKAYKLYLLKYKTWNTKYFFIELLKCLCQEYPAINPYYYDIARELIEQNFPQYSCPEGPPNPDFCIEEPPFITLSPYRRPTAGEIRTKPLLMKASVDAYRLSFVKQLFPKAEFKIIHLTRNPAAGTNGLYDGWLDRGFFSHNVEQVAHLSIPGYSDRFDFGKSWWNYDLPPNWEKMVEHPLEYVCGFQWYSANAAIVEAVAKEDKKNVLKVRAEDILASKTSRWLTLNKITKFLGMELDYSLQTCVETMPVVMATARPHPKRWVQRKDIIWPVVSQSPIAQLAHFLDYSLQQQEQWV